MDVSSTRSSEHAHVGSAGAPLPSPPTDRELAILRRLLGTLPRDVATQLLEQLRMLQVDPTSDETTRIYVLHPDVPRSTCSPTARTKVQSAPVRSPEGRVSGEVAAWVDHGHLRALQYVPHDPRVALTLPDPGSVDVGREDRALPTAAIVHGARGAIAGAQVLEATPSRTRTRTRKSTQARSPWGVAATLVLVLLVLALAAAAFTLGRAGGTDLDAARAAGASAGARDGTRTGAVAGGFAGDVEGELAGYQSTWQAAYDQARSRTLIAARRAALRRRQAAQEEAAGAAAAAAVQPRFVDNSSCPGYRDSRGYWVCS